jgi:ribonuclease-3
LSRPPRTILPPAELAARLGLPADLAHLEEALTHPSFANELRRGPRVDNQRLEFLGDAVLGLAVSELLMSRYPAGDEGVLSLVRSSLVNADALATFARERGVGDALRLGRGADATGERDQTNVLADAVEALVGAVYLDRGFDEARALVRSIVADRLERIAAGASFSARDAKSELQEKVQAVGRPSPRYRVLAVEGPDHLRVFRVAVEVGDDVLAEGRGRSKKLAEQAAARSAIDGLEAAAPSTPPPPGDAP